jgi:hypothetical protein
MAYTSPARAAELVMGDDAMYRGLGIGVLYHITDTLTIYGSLVAQMSHV